MPAGNILLEAGVDYAQDVFYPASGLRGNLWQHRHVRPQLRRELDCRDPDRRRRPQPPDDRRRSNPRAARRACSMFTGDTTSDVEDLRHRRQGPVPVRDRGHGRRWRCASGRGCRTPSNESGLGLDTTDFHFGVAIAQDRPVGARRRQLRVRHPRRSGARRSSERRARLRRLGRARGRGRRRNRRRDQRPAEHAIAARPPIGTESRSVMRVGAPLHARSGPRRRRAARRRHRTRSDVGIHRRGDLGVQGVSRCDSGGAQACAVGARAPRLADDVRDRVARESMRTRTARSQSHAARTSMLDRRDLFARVRRPVHARP